MKKILLIAAMVMLGGVVNIARSQCVFSNFGIKVNSTSTNPVTGNCVVDFDLYFDIDHNAGGKYFWVHVWPTSVYPTAFDYKKPPTTSANGGNGALDSSILTFGFWHFQSALTPLTSYPPDAAAPGFQVADSMNEIMGTPDRYTAYGLTIELPAGCNVSQSLTADGWESQSADAQNVACLSRNHPFYVNDPTVTAGLLYCVMPRMYKFNINTLSPTNRTVNFEVRIDNGDGSYNALLDTLVINSGSVTINDLSPYLSGIIGYPPYSSQKPYANMSLWIILLKNTTDLPNDIYYRIDNTCIPLPVTLVSFSAIRVKENVDLTWSTATEINNKGFYVERNTGNGWTLAGFVPSEAQNGNSDVLINYRYTDLNNTSKTVTQYRLRQTDIDGRMSYSEVRLVKGLGQAAALLVYPNPSHNGSVHVVMDLTEPFDLQLIDMNGRIVRQVMNNIRNELTINGVPAGIYTLRVWMKESHEYLMTKVVVQ